MRINLVGAFIRNFPFGTEIAFKKGFDRLGGHRVTVADSSYEDQILDESADVTVVFKTLDRPEYWDKLARLGGAKVVYQPDDSKFGHIQQMMSELRKYCDFALTFDDDGAAVARSMGYVDAAPLIVTADPDIYKPLHGVKKDIDISFVGSLTGGFNHASRKKMLDLLTSTGFRVVYANDIFDPNVIAQIYNRSKIVLNHATDVGQLFGTGYGYQCRHFEVGFTHSCLLSNTVFGTQRVKGFATFDGASTLLHQANQLLMDADLRQLYADELYEDMVENHKPEKRAAEMVSLLEDFLAQA